MKIVAFVALAALVGCSRNDKTATVEPVGTLTVTSEPITLPLSPKDGELDRRAMFNAASIMPGVSETVDVASLLSATPPDPDDETTTRVQIALLRDPDFLEHARDVAVHVEHGAVTLRGTITSPEARTAAERTTMRQANVTSVKNELRVLPASAAAKSHR